MLRAIAPVRGVARAFVDRGGQVPQLQIEIDRARAARYGLNVADVEDVIETALGGKTATELWEGERKFQRRRPPAAKRSGATSSAIGNVLVDTPGGLADPAVGGRDRVGRQRQHEHRRESGTRVAAIGVFIQGRDMGGVVARCSSASTRRVQPAARLLRARGAASSRTSSGPWRG